MLKNQNKWRPVLFSLMLTATAISVEVTEPQVLEALSFKSKEQKAWGFEQYKDIKKYPAKKYVAYLKSKLKAAKGRSILNTGGLSFKKAKSQNELKELENSLKKVLKAAKEEIEKWEWDESNRAQMAAKEARLSTLNQVREELKARAKEMSAKMKGKISQSDEKMALATQKSEELRHGKSSDRPPSYEEATDLSGEKQDDKSPAIEGGSAYGSSSSAVSPAAAG